MNQQGFARLQLVPRLRRGLVMKRLSIAVLFALACGGGLPPDWQKPCGGHVTAALSSVTLASDCRAKSGAGAADIAGACAPNSEACQAYCRQSSMQLQFASTALTASKIEIRAVRLIDPVTNKVIETLSHREPQQWSGDKYVDWNQSLSANSTIKATYKLSASGQISGYSSDARYGGASKYRVEVDVAVDGELRTLTIEASREPEVVT